MRTMSQREALEQLPDDSMVKKIMLHILNTPKPDFTELDKQIEEENQKWLDSLDEQTRRRVLATPSYQGDIMLLAPINNEKFRYEHLLSNPKNLDDLQSFVVEKKSGKGLERYIKMLL